MACASCKRRSLLIGQAATQLRKGQIAKAAGTASTVGKTFVTDGRRLLQAAKRQIVFK